MKYLRTILCLSVFLLPKSINAQALNDVQLYAHIFDIKQNKRDVYGVSKHNKNEYQVFLNVLFVGYKHFVSSQDANRCSFYPSCSVYAMQAVQKHGIVIGMLEGFDRLTRCNGLSRDQYPSIPDSDLLFDPVK